MGTGLTIFGCPVGLTAYYCMRYYARDFPLAASPDGADQKIRGQRPPQIGSAAPDRRACRLTSQAAPPDARHEPGAAWGGTRAYISAGAKIRARRQPDRRQPALAPVS